jgi:2-amino-4-hydroxy-6-hydroxymethyldihydropteridine diphosphokinase
MTAVTAYLGLGANIGRRASALARAIWLIAEHPAVTVERVSGVYATAPEGVTDQPAFLNMAVEAICVASAEELLELALGVEAQIGRVRATRWGPRAIDIDLLVFGAVRSDTERLTLPHPRMSERQFVLAPLAQIAPTLLLPDGRAVAQAVEPNAPGVRCIGRLAQAVRAEMPGGGMGY